MAAPLSGSVSTFIAASPERVWAIISGQHSNSGPIASERWAGTTGPAVRAPRFPSYPDTPIKAAPQPGEHTDEVLSDWLTLLPTAIAE
jgi:hypothetical protein